MAEALPRPRRERILRIVLVLSLALNLAILGLAAGFALRDQDGRPPRGFDISLGPIGQALAPEDRAAIRDSLRGRSEGPRLQSNRQDEINTLMTALTQEPFDEAALRAALATPVNRMSKLQSDAVDALADRIAAMTQEQRAAFAGRLQFGRRH